MANAIDPHPPKGPGHVVLYDYYKPTLFPGIYEIDARQEIETSDGQQHISVYNYNSFTTVPSIPDQPPPSPSIEKQKFNVLASQFQIDPKAVNSVYPPSGAADEGRILPHIVFNDPHLPWESPPFPRAAEPAFRQKVWPPWFALVVFDPKELKFDLAAQLNLGIPSEAKYSPYTGAYTMSVSDYLHGVQAKPNYEKGYEFDFSKLKEISTSPHPVDVIFPTKGVVSDIFKDPAKFRYMCHVRQLDNHGLPDTATENNGLYSICVSHRSGPIMAMDVNNPPAPRPQVVHLVSIQCLVDADGNLVPPTTVDGSDRIGLVSLYSWTYLATPPASNNVVSIMRDLGAGKQPLMPPRSILDAITSSVSKGNDSQKSAAKTLQARLAQGYSIVRWRTATGEETAAFNRGPLIPNVMTSRPSRGSDWPDSSNTGKEFQILDKSIGLMDLTYSAAWQLGRMLAISDTVLASALLRFRSTIHQRASSHVRMLSSNMTPAPHLLNRMRNTLAGMNIATENVHAPIRMSHPVPSVANSTVLDAGAIPLFHSAILREASTLAGISALQSGDLSGLSSSPDFEVIKNWIDRKLLLYGIPFHYLVTDPSHLSTTPDGINVRGKIDLPPEALRFFHIDDNWLDCFLDGALSTANHLDPIDDTVRRAIKQIYNEYLKSTKRPTPRYGFLLRSSIVKSIPDLRVTTRYRKSDGHGGWTEDGERDPVLRHTKIDEYTILTLLECLPEDLYSIIISQPAHQQRFVAPIPPLPGEKYFIKRLYTAGAPERSPQQRALDELDSATDGMWEDLPQTDVAAWYNSRTRCVNVERMTADLGRLLPFSSPPAVFHADIGSAVLSLQLNDKSFYLDILPPDLSVPNSSLPPRQLWLRSSLTIQPVVGLGSAQPPLPSPPDPMGPSSGLGGDASSTVISVVTPRSSTLDTNWRVLSLTSHDFSSTPVVSGPRIEIPPPEETNTPIILFRDRYLLSLHPSYRRAPPLPFSGANNRRVFSSTDYVPALAPNFVDLVFTLRRNLFGINSTRLVSSLTIIVPTTSGDASGDVPPQEDEPLLVAPYRGSGASMLHNKRLTAVIATAPGQLQIKLVARNAAPNSEIPLANTHTADASFVLKGCEIAATKTSVSVEVMGEGLVQRGLAKVGIRKRLRPLMLGQPTRVEDWAVLVVKKEVET
jgi:hypothetical protein